MMVNCLSANLIWSSLFRSTSSVDAGMSGSLTGGSTMGPRDRCSNDAMTERPMKNTSRSFLALAAALLLIPGLSRAHHGWAAFASEPGSQISLKGTVKEFHFVNPHSVIELEIGRAHV